MISKSFYSLLVIKQTYLYHSGTTQHKNIQIHPKQKCQSGLPRRFPRSSQTLISRKTIFPSFFLRIISLNSTHELIYDKKTRIPTQSAKKFTITYLGPLNPARLTSQMNFFQRHNIEPIFFSLEIVYV